MMFKPELVEKILAGEKTQTRRAMSDNPRSPWFRGACTYKRGHTYAIQPGRGKPGVAQMVVTNVRQQMLGLMEEWEAKNEGFASLEEFKAYWTKLNGSWRDTQFVWVIVFARKGSL